MSGGVGVFTSGKASNRHGINYEPDVIVQIFDFGINHRLTLINQRINVIAEFLGRDIRENDVIVVGNEVRISR